MEASTRIPTPPLSFEPNTEKIKRNLLKKGVSPTPKIVHTLRKKEIQKFNRKSKKVLDKTSEKPLSEAQKQEIAEESHFQTIKHEYKTIRKVLTGRNEEKDRKLMVGKPWERLERSGLRELASGSKEYGGEKLKGEHLLELQDIFEKRNHAEKHWLLDEDIEEGEWMETGGRKEASPKRQLDDAEAIQFLVKRLSAMNLTTRDWKFPKLMKQSGLHFTELHLLRIVEGLGAAGCWGHALSVVEWIYNCSEYKNQKSRFVYTKLLAVLGKSRKPMEALRIYNLMLEDCRIYPDLAAYHCISVTLGQAGLVKDLVNIIERMRKTPSKKLKNTRSKNWDPCLEPDVVVYNAVLNACVSSHQWKGVSWVMEEMRKSGLKPNGATYGLAMEVMLRSGKYDLVHKYFEKMRKSGAGPKAITYKVLVRAFWEEGKVNEAVEAVRDMERRGVVGTASVYYELACCLCKNGRWKEAIVEVENLKKLRLTKPLEVTFTGMIISCMEGGHLQDSISLFHQMNHHCSPNIGTINAMLKVYGQNDMFLKAKELFETTKETHPSSPDAFTYSAILEASANAQQWEYFEYLYKEMALRGYQIDQNKHSWLLVEASIAGKGHLLEHAFDTILEAGEIPCLSFFVQMVCEAMTKLNYERAVNLLNSMAHASFQVSEKQWTEFLIGISKDKLECLFDKLSNSDVKKEVTISNLLKSIESTCGDSIDLVAFCGESEDQVDSVGAKCVEYGSSDSESCEEVQDSVDKTLELLTGGEDFSRSELPQASEILKNWRENRNKDGIFLPFQSKSRKN